MKNKVNTSSRTILDKKEIKQKTSTELKNENEFNTIPCKCTMTLEYDICNPDIQSKLKNSILKLEDSTFTIELYGGNLKSYIELFTELWKI